MNFVNKIELSIDGKSLKTFSSLSLQQNIFGHHSLEVVFQRDTFEKEGNLILDESDKFLGGKIDLKINAENDNKNEFTGIVTEISASKTDGSFGGDIVISAQSPDILLDDGEHCRSFEDKSLKKIIDKILKEYQFDTKKITPKISTDNIPYTVQYKESAYAFISRLAAKKGEWFFYNGKDLVFGKLPDKKVKLQYGIDLFHFDFSLKLDDLKFKYIAYDYLNEEVLSSDSGSQKVSKMSDKAKVGYDKSEKLYTHETQSLYNNALSESSAKAHLDNRVKLVKSAQTAGLITLNGSSDNPNLILGCEISISESYGEKDKKKTKEHGKYIITSISHSCDRIGNYQNNFSAIPAEIDVPPYTSPHAIPYCETQSARVMDNNDPEALGRIQVQFAWQKDENTVSPWLRVITPHSGKEQGFYFTPEIGDEVLVAFEGGNAEKPYVLGSLYHGKAKPDTLFDAENNIKAIRTRSGHTIEFNDTDGAEELKIYDYNKENYIITLASYSKEIKIESQGDIQVNAEGYLKIDTKGNIDINSTGNMNLESKGDFKIKGSSIKMESDTELESKATNIKTEAQAQMEIKSGATMDVKASAKMTVDGGALLEQKGGLIKIN